MLLPFGIGDVPTPNVRLDVWDHVGSYTICMLLVCRLKIISSPNLKLIISFLALPLVLLCHTSCYHLLSQCSTLLLTSRVNLRLAIRPSAQFANLLYKNNLQAMGPVLPFSKSRKCISRKSLHCVILRARSVVAFFLLFAQREKARKLLRTSYIRGPNSNGSSTKRRNPLSRS
jgi:hypothetical protein